MRHVMTILSILLAVAIVVSLCILKDHTSEDRDPAARERATPTPSAFEGPSHHDTPMETRGFRGEESLSSGQSPLSVRVVDSATQRAVAGTDVLYLESASLPSPHFLLGGAVSVDLESRVCRFGVKLQTDADGQIQVPRPSSRAWALVRTSSQFGLLVLGHDAPSSAVLWMRPSTVHRIRAVDALGSPTGGVSIVIQARGQGAPFGPVVWRGVTSEDTGTVIVQDLGPQVAGLGLTDPVLFAALALPVRDVVACTLRADQSSDHDLLVPPFGRLQLTIEGAPSRALAVRVYPEALNPLRLETRTRVPLEFAAVAPPQMWQVTTRDNPVIVPWVPLEESVLVEVLDPEGELEAPPISVRGPRFPTELGAAHVRLVRRARIEPAPSAVASDAGGSSQLSGRVLVDAHVPAQSLVIELQGFGVTCSPRPDGTFDVHGRFEGDLDVAVRLRGSGEALLQTTHKISKATMGEKPGRLPDLDLRGRLHVVQVRVLDTKGSVPADVDLHVESLDPVRELSARRKGFDGTYEILTDACPVKVRASAPGHTLVEGLLVAGSQTLILKEGPVVEVSLAPGSVLKEESAWAFLSLSPVADDGRDRSVCSRLELLTRDYRQRVRVPEPGSYRVELVVTVERQVPAAADGTKEREALTLDLGVIQVSDTDSRVRVTLTAEAWSLATDAAR